MSKRGQRPTIANLCRRLAYFDPCPRGEIGCSGLQRKSNYFFRTIIYQPNTLFIFQLRYNVIHEFTVQQKVKEGNQMDLGLLRPNNHYQHGLCLFRRIRAVLKINKKLRVATKFLRSKTTIKMEVLLWRSQFFFQASRL